MAPLPQPGSAWRAYWGLVTDQVSLCLTEIEQPSFPRAPYVLQHADQREATVQSCPLTPQINGIRETMRRQSVRVLPFPACKYLRATSCKHCPWGIQKSSTTWARYSPVAFFNQPGFAGLARTPHGKIMTAAFLGGAYKLVNTAFDQFAALNKKVGLRLNRAVGMESAHKVFVLDALSDGKGNPSVARRGSVILSIKPHSQRAHFYIAYTHTSRKCPRKMGKIMAETVHVGTHRAWIEGDVMRVTHAGPISLAEMQELHRFLERWYEERGVRYLMMDIRAMPPPEPEVRKWMAQPKKSAPVRAVIAVGASPAVRVISTLMRKAMELLGNRSETPFLMMKSEEEAFAWIENDRGVQLSSS